MTDSLVFTQMLYITLFSFCYTWVLPGSLPLGVETSVYFLLTDFLTIMPFICL